MQFSSKTPIDHTIHKVYNAVCTTLKSRADNASFGSLTYDGWHAALGTPILGITWHYVDQSWRLKGIPIETRNLANSSKSGLQICAILEDIMQINPIFWSDRIRVNMITTDNEESSEE